MSHDPEGKVTFKSSGRNFTAIFAYRAMKEIERRYDLPFFRAIQHIMPSVDPADAGDQAKIAEASADIRFGDVGNLLQFSLMKFHPTIDEDAVEKIIDDIGIEEACRIIGEALAAALQGKGGKDSQNPPKASRKKSTG